MLRLVLSVALFAGTAGVAMADGVPYSEHGDVTGETEAEAEPHEIEPAAGEAQDVDSEAVPYSEHGEVIE